MDSLSIKAVDHQVLPKAGTEDINNEYIIQHDGHWNGNDILFISSSGETYEYNNAKVFSKIKTKGFSALKDYKIFSKQALDKVARRTFQQSNIDLKAMAKKAGIKLVKPKRVRKTTGKTRGNCPTCGRVTWDFNPYENAYCTECKPY